MRSCLGLLEGQYQTCIVIRCAAKQHSSGRFVVTPAGERDDFKSLLMASLQRLEAVDRVVQRVDQSNAAMEEQVASLENEKKKAEEAAAAAKSQVEALLKSQRRVEWQNKVR